MAFLKNLFKKGKSKEPTKKSRPEDGSRILDAAPAASGPAAAPSIAAPIGQARAILKSFHVSEKSARGMAMNQYTFIIDPHATKTQVRDAVHASYRVDVVSVNLVRLPSKQRRIGRHVGSVSGKRKAIVTLKAGQTIAAAQP